MLRVYVDATSDHFQLACIFTGLSLLERAGRIRLSQKVRRVDTVDPSAPQHLRTAGSQRLTIEVVPTSGRPVRVAYDCHDAGEPDAGLLARSDLYFKRSYDPHMAPEELRGRLRPLGLTFGRYPAYTDWKAAERSVRLKAGRLRFKAAIDALRGTTKPDVEQMILPPNPGLEPRVLLMLRAWDPQDDPDRAPEKVRERECINESRAEAVRLLRREFGPRFTGGFSHTPFAVRHYRDVLVEDPRLSEQQSYLRLLRDFPVAIATTGLHGSNGWKLGEYVSLSRAIISEPLRFGVPGAFEPEVNYLEYSTPEDLVAAAGRLFDDRELRHTMMEANHQHARQFVDADRLVWNTLRQAEELSSQPEVLAKVAR